MAATLTTIDYAGTPITTLKGALNSKSLITSVLYEDDDCLIFSTPLTSKVIKIKVDDNVFSMAYGDAWTSAETVTKEVIFASRNNGTTTSLYCIADTTWFFMAWESTTYLYQGYVGALDSGDVLVFGFSSSTSMTYFVNNKAMNVTDGVQLLPVSLSSHLTFKNPSGKLLKMPLMWYNPTNKTLEMNGTVPAKTVGAYVSSWRGGSLNTDLGANYYLTGSDLYMHYSGAAAEGLRMALLVEFTA